MNNVSSFLKELDIWCGQNNAVPPNYAGLRRKVGDMLQEALFIQKALNCFTPSPTTCKEDHDVGERAYRVRVSDTITFEREGFMVVRASSLKQALVFAEERANDVGLHKFGGYTETQIDNTPYEAESAPLGRRCKPKALPDAAKPAGRARQPQTRTT